MEVHGFHDSHGPLPSQPEPDAGQWPHSGFGIPLAMCYEGVLFVMAGPHPDFSSTTIHYKEIGLFRLVHSEWIEGLKRSFKGNWELFLLIRSFQHGLSEVLVAPWNKGIAEVLAQIASMQLLLMQSQHSL